MYRISRQIVSVSSQEQIVSALVTPQQHIGAGDRALPVARSAMSFAVLWVLMLPN